MPYYDYQCTACGETFEACSLPDADKIVCIQCGKSARRVWLTPPSIDARGEYYDEGLGCIITSSNHRRRIMRERRLKECGKRLGNI